MKDRFKGEPEEYNARHRLLITASTLESYDRAYRPITYARYIRLISMWHSSRRSSIQEEQYIVRAWLGDNVRLFT